MAITFVALAAFFAVIIAVLHVSKKRQDLSTFSHYAVGERSFSSWFVAMAYTNSWWPGATFTVFFGLGITSGVLGFYALVYTVLGVMAMYFMARPVWKWGKRFDLRTQSDLLVLRYNKPAIKPLSSIISSLALFPWLVLGLQAMGAVISWASFGKLSLTTCILVGVGLIAIRQFWTIQMGMRGLIISDMVQGLVAYVGSAVLSLCLIMFYFHGLHGVGELPAAKLSLPDFHSSVGGWFYFGIVAAGVIGSLCWPNIMTRIYTAGSVRQVKKGVIQTMAITLVFYGLMTLVAMAAIPFAFATNSPESAWFAIAQNAGGTWLLAAALLIVFGATMGFVDGVVQSLGTQMANDIVGAVRPLRDKQEIVIAKSAMVVYVLLAAVAAYQTYAWPNLVNLAQLSYQGIIQIAVPLFAGLFWRRGNGVAAIAGLVAGAVVAIGLSVTYFSEAGAIPWLAGIGSGLVGLAANLVVYVLCSYLVPTSQAERKRVNELFEHARSGRVEAGARPASVTSSDAAPATP
ncbi:MULTISPECIES: sodium:solute symporter family protein [Streptomyces]|uniref:Sodium:solute symporter family protein n=1 Tax=Streptomyces mordarskii TaxID=1226758 RepID=A0ABN1C9L3_9ACTN|nr:MULTISPECIES: sodium:solute symporter family protein [unclassified Streptomyces]QTI88291.1 sodium:solute symporter family protein [Streptomyces sp. AgN23]RSS45083.1 sodium:solute symporter family protein [Streptomyces sp. WAC05858]WTA80601.1 sodium:solute symporter family protein [Streptomyces antimycoticus]